ncbi:hypothetical protein SporoP37_15860 [Sporosarcina sp. P37]|uniref:hypothetical protein n=1 Tax=unclassified Sporosarcina TaxID=2647733 RepID=UPI000A17E4E0|nr:MULTISPECIES: hypothetical protein [unclassified Sporosarcina]ARK26002.1 hypothetical protein SporoP37_15860 [Sporosarcina sp. P37]PID19370.1 hypothetical protein CSV62_02380 [Sporosarcina sp. P35]
MSKAKESNPEEPVLKKEKVVKEASAPIQADVFIYVGPTSKRLTRYASFTNGLPTHLEEHFTACPVLRKLFIPVEEFMQFEQHVTDSSSVEYMLFQKASDYFKGVKE